MANLLFVYFLDMLKAADAHLITFETYHDNINDMYKKMPYDEQGKYHQFISNYMIYGDKNGKVS